MAETCTACGFALPYLALACPQCRQFVHTARLEELSRQAKAKEGDGKPAEALALWEKVLALLPPESTQHAQVRDRIATVGAAARTAEAHKERPGWLKALGPLGVAGALVLGKGKFLLLGLGKLKTLLSMLAFLGVYWSLYGWQFAAGFVAGIYIHEMGHVWALNRFGLRAGAPMFIPGFGAFVSLYESPANVGQDARIGLAGPVWGAAAAVGFWLPGTLLGSGLLLAIAHTTAWLNLFNLTPVWQLDGGRGFRALDRMQRISILVLLLLLWAVTRENTLWIPIAGAVYRALVSKDAPAEGDRTVLFQFTGLAVLLTALMASVAVPR